MIQVCVEQMLMVLIVPLLDQRNLHDRMDLIYITQKFTIHSNDSISFKQHMENGIGELDSFLTNCNERCIEFMSKHEPAFVEKILIDHQVKV